MGQAALEHAVTFHFCVELIVSFRREKKLMWFSMEWFCCRLHFEKVGISY